MVSIVVDDGSGTFAVKSNNIMMTCHVDDVASDASWESCRSISICGDGDDDVNGDDVDTCNNNNPFASPAPSPDLF